MQYSRISPGNTVLTHRNKWFRKGSRPTRVLGPHVTPIIMNHFSGENLRNCLVFQRGDSINIVQLDLIRVVADLSRSCTDMIVNRV